MSNDTLTAADLMHPLRGTAKAHWDVISLAEFFIEHRLKSSPVIDGDGKVIGVVGLEDIAHFTLESDESLSLVHHGYYTDRIEFDDEEMHEGIDVREDEHIRVVDITRPVLHAVAESAPLAIVCRLMTLKKLHRLLVLDDRGTLAGVITALDIIASIGTSMP